MDTGTDTQIQTVECNNYKSATCQENRPAVENQLHEEIVKGRYLVTLSKPTIVSALGAIPKDNNDVRLIHDCSRPDKVSVNSFATPDKMTFESVDTAVKLIKPHD